MKATTLLFCMLLPAAAAAETFVITGATVHTAGPRGTVEDATVIVRDGRIDAVGTDLRVPGGVMVIDAQGRAVTPGYIDAWGSMGVAEISGVEQTMDTAVDDARISASFGMVDAYNPRSTVIGVNRIEGITTGIVAPRVTGQLVAGQAIAVSFGDGGDWLLDDAAALAVELGERGAELSGGARGAAMHRLREALQDARDYGDNRDAFERRARRDYALSRLDLEALQPVIRGEVPVVASVDRASDIEAVLRLAHEYGLRLVIEGGAEAWLVADALAAAGVPVILDPLANLPGSFERLAATGENAARLHAAGVSIAFVSGDRNARNVRQAAGNAVARGLPWDAALAAITANPARMFGLGGRTGSLEPGKRADLVLWNGDPLELSGHPEQVWIAGEAVPMRSRQTELRDRYMDKLGLP